METNTSEDVKKLFSPFKSYYVVWKPLFKQLSRFDTACLNRTMQYGNCDEVYRQRICECRLNRTMQYGNVVHPNVRNCCVRGLNRTMQYGNNVTFCSTDEMEKV